MSNAPDKIWASAGSYPKFDDNDWTNASASADIEFGIEYTRTDAITPQQAAKVFLAAKGESDFIIGETTIEPGDFWSSIKAISLAVE